MVIRRWKFFEIQCCLMFFIHPLTRRVYDSITHFESLHLCRINFVIIWNVNGFLESIHLPKMKMEVSQCVQANRIEPNSINSNNSRMWQRVKKHSNRKSSGDGLKGLHEIWIHSHICFRRASQFCFHFHFDSFSLVSILRILINFMVENSWRENLRFDRRLN